MMIPALPGRVAFVVPAYEPTGVLADLVESLTRGDDRAVIVVDDGSSPACRRVFERLERNPRVVLLVHAANLGKGQALKSAFNYVLLHGGPELIGVVTADADGQHLAADIHRVAERLEASPARLVLGSRAFEGPVPLRSRLGNLMTRAVFRLLIGRRLVDTQTGLRGIPRGFLAELIQVEAGRYEFELEMLVRAAEHGLPIEEVAIQTVYGSFAVSHFNPLRDSLRIYFVFLRFIGLSILTAAIDYSIFALVYLARGQILAAFLAARAVAGVFNFSMNRTIVFRSRGGVPLEAGKYVALVIALMGVSYGLVTTLVGVFGMGVFAAKIVAEGGLFLASFALQNLVVFADRRPAADVANQNQ